MVLARQPVEGQSFVDILFAPAGELRILRRPLGEPGGEIAARLDEITPIVQPAQLLQTVVVDPARHVVERVAQKMHIAALVSRFRKNLAQRCPQAGVIVGDVQTRPHGDPAPSVPIGNLASWNGSRDWRARPPAPGGGRPSRYRSRSIPPG